MHKREDIYKALDVEREHQEVKWVDVAHDHTLTSFMLKIHDAVYEGRSAAIQGEQSFEKYMQAIDQLRKIAALSIAAMERYGYTRRYENKD